MDENASCRLVQILCKRLSKHTADCVTGLLNQFRATQAR